MKPFLLCFLATGLLCRAAHAQTTFHFGPQAGLNLTTYNLPENRKAFGEGYRSGVEVGLLGVLQRKHWAIQATGLYAQRGYAVRDGTVNYLTGQNRPAGVADYTYLSRLDYLTLALALAYIQGPTGEGLQAFAGPYAAWLLGGRYLSAPHDGPVAVNGRIVPVAEKELVGISGTDTYARRLDAGVQAGVGYRKGGALVQASYCLGLRDLTAAENTGMGVGNSPSAFNRAFRLSLAYLFHPKA